MEARRKGFFRKYHDPAFTLNARGASLNKWRLFMGVQECSRMLKALFKDAQGSSRLFIHGCSRLLPLFRRSALATLSLSSLLFYSSVSLFFLPLFEVLFSSYFLSPVSFCKCGCVRIGGCVLVLSPPLALFPPVSVCAYWWMWMVCMCHDTLFALSLLPLFSILLLLLCSLSLESVCVYHVYHVLIRDKEVKICGAALGVIGSRLQARPAVATRQPSRPRSTPPYAWFLETSTKLQISLFSSCSFSPSLFQRSLQTGALRKAH